MAKKKFNRKKENPFLFLAQGLSADDRDIWEIEPVSIQEFIEGKEYMNLKWDGKKGCRPRIMEIAKNLADDNTREALLLLGKGCLTGDTIIYTREFGSAKMRDLCGKIFHVLSYDENEEVIWNGAVCVDSGEKYTRSYRFANGKYLKASDNHTVNVIGKGDIPISQMRIGDKMRYLVESIHQGGVGYTSLVEVEDGSEEWVYDIKCEEPNHNYCANGLFPQNSGKDFISSLFHLYGIYKCLCMYSPQAYYGLSPGTSIYFVNTARNDTQAKKVFFTQFKAHLENCAWFGGKYEEPGVASVKFMKGIEALSVNSQAFGWLGFNTIQWVGDELAFFLESDSNEESDSRAEECWEAAYGSCKTRFPEYYKMIGITTPRYDDDFVMRKFEELKHSEHGYVVQAATWDIHPLLTKEDFAEAFKKNYRRTMRDFGAVPSGVIETFWPEPDYISNNVCEKCKECPIYKNASFNDDIYSCMHYEECTANIYCGNGNWREWAIPDPSKEYYMHFDLSINGDRTGFTLGHVHDTVKVQLDPHMVQMLRDKNIDIDEEDEFINRSLTKIDAIGFISANSPHDDKLTKNGNIYYDGIYQHIVVSLLNLGYNIISISFDRFQSHYMRQRIEDLGIETELISTDRTDDVPVSAKNATCENRVEYPFSMLLCDEAKYLKYFRGTKVDHVAKKSKDVWDSYACVVYKCEDVGMDQSSFVGLGE